MADNHRQRPTNFEQPVTARVVRQTPSNDSDGLDENYSVDRESRAGGSIKFDSASARTLTFEQLRAGVMGVVHNRGAGAVTMTAGTGVTLTGQGLVALNEDRTCGYEYMSATEVKLFGELA